MKNNKKLFIGLVIGILLSGGVSIFILISQHQAYRKAETELQQTYHAQQAEWQAYRKGERATLMSQLLVHLDEELKQNPKRVLSDATIYRIASLCYAFKPYPPLDQDTLTAGELSPERGQLLLVLIRMDLDSGILHQILRKAPFSYADLRETDLSHTDLEGAYLKGANLRGANLEGAHCRGTDFSFSTLWGANLNQAQLKGANLQRADLRWSLLNGANLANADLSEADLTAAQMRNADLHGAILKWADLIGTILPGSNLKGADLFRTNLRRAQLEKANLREANLTLAILSEAHLTEADLTHSNLSGLYLTDPEWLAHLQEWRVLGADSIPFAYTIGAGVSYDKSPYQLKKKED